MIDIEAFERDRKRRRAARWKRLMLWAGATAGIAIISLVVALALMRSAGGPENATGIGWSLGDVQRKWGDDEGWDWYHAEPALSGEPGVIDYRARHAGGRTEQIQVVGIRDNLRCFQVLSSIEPGEDASDPEKLAAWSLRASAMAAEVAGADSRDVAKWFITVFWRFTDRVVDHHEITHAESRTFGGVTLHVMFVLLKTGFMSTVGVGPLEDPRNAETASVQQEQDSEPALPKSVFDRIFALADPALPEGTRDRWLAENNSTRGHWNRMMRMGREMIRLHYLAAGEGTPMTHERLRYFIASGASHIKVADSYLYEMEWRLVAVAGDRANDVPVSFLSADYDGPLTHDLAVAVVNEFARINRGVVDLDVVRTAMKQAEARHKDTKRGDLNSTISWLTQSDIHEAKSSFSSYPDYAIRVDVREWPKEDYTREEGAVWVLIYFVYLPPGKDIDLSHVWGGGFGAK